jgi:hypothetical protein
MFNSSFFSNYAEDLTAISITWSKNKIIKQKLIVQNIKTMVFIAL